MKKLLLFTSLILSIYSCVTVRFPETINVDITVPEDFDIEKMQILIDTLKGVDSKGQNKINGTVEFLLHKAEPKKEKKSSIKRDDS